MEFTEYFFFLSERLRDGHAGYILGQIGIDRRELAAGTAEIVADFFAEKDRHQKDNGRDAQTHKCEAQIHAEHDEDDAD